MMKGHRRQHGFTLVELMLVVAVIAIIASLAVPMMGDMVDRRHVTGAAEAVQAEIRFARGEAIKRSREVVVAIDPEGPWLVTATYRVEEIDGVSEEVIDDLIKTLPNTPFDDVTLNAGGLAKIAFTPVRGLAICTDTNGATAPCNDAIDLTSAQGRKIRALINAMGRVSLCSPEGDGYMERYEEC